MSTAAINSVTTSNPANKPTTKGFDSLQSSDFFKLLITQLQSQDPLKPTDNETLMNQLSSIRNMQQSTTLNDTLSNLANQQRFGSASNLIGHYVGGTVTDGSGHSTVLKGVVTSVRFEQGGKAILELNDGNELPAEDVQQVTLVENLPQDVQQQIINSSNAAASTAKTKQAAAMILPGATNAFTSMPTQAAAPNDGGLLGNLARALFGGTGVTAGPSL